MEQGIRIFVTERECEDIVVLTHMKTLFYRSGAVNTNMESEKSVGAFLIE